MNTTSKVILGIVVAVIVLGGAGWFAFTNPSVASALGITHASPNGMASTTPRGGRFGGARGGFATGSIEVLSGDGFTMTLQDGTTKVVTIAATTTLENFPAASSTPAKITADQLSVGEQVRVIGAVNADGSIAARSVMTGILPAMNRSGMRGGPGRMASGTPQGGPMAGTQ